MNHIVHVLVGFIGTVGGIHYKIPNAQRTQSGLYVISSFVELGVVSSIEVNVETIGKLSVVVRTIFINIATHERKNRDLLNIVILKMFSLTLPFLSSSNCVIALHLLQIVSCKSSSPIALRPAYIAIFAATFNRCKGANIYECSDVSVSKP